MSNPTERPELSFCPYCGAQAIKVQRLVPRCMKCRAVFFVQFSRYLRRPPS
jgi:hypothetical protein